MRPILWKGSLCALIIATGLWTGFARPDDGPDEVQADHANCALFFGKDREANSPALARRNRFQRSALTELVATRLPGLQLAPAGSSTSALQQTAQKSTIDKYIFQGFEESGVAPAPTATDAEFLRRASLDLTGTNSQARTGGSFSGRHLGREAREVDR